MLRAVDFSEDDFSKPIVTVACPFTNATPCNDHIRKLGDILSREIVAAGGKPFQFGTPVISDGETMGMEGMKYSLMSRDLIADCIETMHEGYAADGIVTLSGCDKSIPGALMPILRNNGIGLTLYGGTHPAGPVQGGRPHDRERVRGDRGPTRGGKDDGRGAAAGGVPLLPRRGLVRGDVHGQHDGVGDRGDGAFRSRFRLPRGGGPGGPDFA